MSLPLAVEAFCEEAIKHHLARTNDISYDIDEMNHKKLIACTLDEPNSLPAPPSYTRNSTGSTCFSWGDYPVSCPGSLNLMVFVPLYPYPLERIVVYCFHCSDCPSVYFGETSWQFCIRIQEYLHEANSTDSLKKSSFADHFATQSRRSNIDYAILVHFQNSWKGRITSEEIQRNLVLPCGKPLYLTMYSQTDKVSWMLLNTSRK